MDKLLYHYTTIDSLYKILQPNKDGEISIRATHAKFMNDPFEYEYALKIIKDSMVEFEKRNEVVEKKSKYFFSENETDFLSSITMGAGDPFLLSFSEQQDDLSMWRAYGKDGKGVCIGFDFAELEKFANNNSIGKLIGFIECIYDRNTAFETMLEIWTEIYDEFFILNEKPALNLSNGLSSWIILIKLCFMLKCNSYKSEKEWRLCTLSHNEYDIKVRENILVPFFVHTMPKEMIRQIVIGPCLDKVQSKKGLEMFLKKLDYKTCSIVESDISYRQI